MEWHNSLQICSLSFIIPTMAYNWCICTYNWLLLPLKTNNTVYDMPRRDYFYLQLSLSTAIKQSVFIDTSLQYYSVICSDKSNTLLFPVDAYTLEESSYEVPIGSDLRIDVIFTQFTFDDAVQYTFIPLDHTPLQQPTFILSDSSVVGVRYAIVSPSLAGEYVLCRLDLCGSRITIIVTSMYNNNLRV